MGSVMLNWLRELMDQASKLRQAEYDNGIQNRIYG